MEILLTPRCTDEQVRLYAVLRLPRAPSDSLQARLFRLELRLELWIIDQPPFDAPGPEGLGEAGLGRHQVASQLIDTQQDPIVIVQGDEDREHGDNSPDEQSVCTLICWETSITVSRPKVRLPNPNAVFVLSSSIKPHNAHDSGHGYLPSFEPLPVNVFEPLRSLPGLHDYPPYLSSTRLERVKPRSSISDSLLRLPQKQRYPVKVFPALIARFRGSSQSATIGETATLASLEIEVVPFIDIEGLLEEIHVSLAHGRVEPLSTEEVPIPCRSRDCFVFLYKLYSSKFDVSAHHSIPTDQFSSDPEDFGVATISLTFKVSVSDHCDSIIRMDWATNVELSRLRDKPAQPRERQSRLPVFGANSRPTTSEANAEEPSRKVSMGGGVICTFTAPEKPVQVGRPFHWQVHIYNGTASVARLAVVPLPRLQRATAPTLYSYMSRHHLSKASNISHGSVQRPSSALDAKSQSTKPTPSDLAQPVLDENVLYAMTHSRPRAADASLISLTPEIRVGPLGPGACHEGQLTMMAFSTGCLSVDCIRLIDLVREGQQGPEDEAREGGHRKAGVIDVLSKDLPVTWVVGG